MANVTLSPEALDAVPPVASSAAAEAKEQKMRNATDAPPCDGCDTLLAIVNSPSDRQRRFLEAYRQQPTIAVAARMAGVHRATIYRWLTTPAFADALRDAADAFYRAHRAKVMQERAAREQWRRERERERWPMRCEILARARAAKRR